MWITLEDVKHYDSIVEYHSGTSLQKMLREAEKKAAKAETAAKAAAKAAAKTAAKTAAKAAAKAAKEAETKVVINSHFELNMGVRDIGKIVKMPQKEIKAIIAKEEERRKGNAN